MEGLPRLGHGWRLDALGFPQRLDLWAYIAWVTTADARHAATGWHPSWLAKDRVGRVEVSTVFLPVLGRLPRQPFETWVRGPSHHDFYRYASALEARAGHWCLVWQLRQAEG
jgi:hypothetical protein